jgi:glycosyltransferase involved in cell wall biosynthesis
MTNAGPAAMTWSPDGGLKWAIIVAGSQSDAERYAHRSGLRGCLLLSKEDLLSDPGGFRRKLKTLGVNALAVHSSSWARQGSPQVYEMALAIAPVARRYIVDAERDTVFEVARHQVALALMRLPADLLWGLGVIGRETLTFSKGRRGQQRSSSMRPVDRGAVVAIWHGLRGGEIGGAATHIAGILGGFKSLGLRIGLVTTESPPPQLLPVVDEVEIAPPLPPAGRVTGDVEALAINRPLRAATSKLANRMRPAFIYQRHRVYLVAGADVARGLRCPLVLEWNNSEIWMRAAYERQFAAERLLDPLAKAMERRVVRCADLTVAVSSPAMEMAIQQGADPDRVTVVPNGVDLAEIPPLAEHDGREDAPVIGWIGTFGQWHGAEILVQALPLLATDARLLMIGDGELRPACEALARQLGVWERVEWTGAIPHSHALERLADCDLLASPHVQMPNQRFFGSPTKLFEYLAIGRPIVASRLEQIGEILEDGLTARLVTPGDPHALAEAIEEVLSSPDRGEALGRAARAEARKHTWHQRARTIVTALSSSTSSGPTI